AVAANAAALAALRERIKLVPQLRRAELQRDAPLGRLVEPGDAVEDRCLAGAVRADQRGDGTALGGEREIVHGHEAAKAHGQVLDPQDRGDRRAHPCPSRTSAASIALRLPSATVGSRVPLK